MYWCCISEPVLCILVWCYASIDHPLRGLISREMFTVALSYYLHACGLIVSFWPFSSDISQWQVVFFSTKKNKKNCWLHVFCLKHHPLQTLDNMVFENPRIAAVPSALEPPCHSINNQIILSQLSCVSCQCLVKRNWICVCDFACILYRGKDMICSLEEPACLC